MQTAPASRLRFRVCAMHPSIEPTVAALTTLESALPTHPDIETVATLRRVLSTWRGAMDAQCLRDLEAVLTPALQSGLERVAADPRVVALTDEHRILTLYVTTCAGILARNAAVARVKTLATTLGQQLDTLDQSLQRTAERLQGLSRT